MEDVLLIHIVLSVLIGSGYLVIYCFYDNAELFSSKDPLFDLSLFAEIHIFTEKNTNNDDSLASLKYYIYAHTYIYIHFDKTVNDDVRKKITKYKSQYVHVYALSKKFDKMNSMVILFVPAIKFGLIYISLIIRLVFNLFPTIEFKLLKMKIPKKKKERSEDEDDSVDNQTENNAQIIDHNSDEFKKILKDPFIIARIVTKDFFSFYKKEKNERN